MQETQQQQNARIAKIQGRFNQVHVMAKEIKTRIQREYDELQRQRHANGAVRMYEEYWKKRGF